MWQVSLEMIERCHCRVLEGVDEDIFVKSGGLFGEFWSLYVPICFVEIFIFLSYFHVHVCTVVI